ncbi:MAG TPA: diguanylate cyclase [Thermoleophilaceae bacterium]
MSFRSRLLVFFTAIVVVPMIALAFVLFSITSDAETGKADARIAGGLRVAFSVYERDRGAAQSELRALVASKTTRSALASGDRTTIRRTFQEELRRHPAIESLVLYDPSGRSVVQEGTQDAVAPSTAAPTTADGERLGTLAVSTTSARRYAEDVAGLTGLDARVFVGARRAASTLTETKSAEPRSGDIDVGGNSYRGRFETIREPVGPPLHVGVFDQADTLASSIDRRRIIVGGVLLAVFLAALALAIWIARSLQGEIGRFLKAARRIAGGDFEQPIETHGHDEFAALGSEFNKMSEDLARMIEEVSSKRRELEDTMRRVGEAFATGLDREGLVELAVRTAVEACEADSGRALPLDARRMNALHVGHSEKDLLDALEGAERRAFAIEADNVSELLARLEPAADEPPEQHGPTGAEVSGVHALAMPLRARLGSANDFDQVGVIAIARRGRDFTETERDLFGYLASQAAVSLENANLHETVQRQAVTDELTGLFNVRHFHVTLDYEVERTRRFQSEVSLVMIDIDDFKQVNDTYGHQQGDLVLIEVGRVLRELSRDIDEPARYGGEELAVVLPQTDVLGAELAAERMRAAIERLEIRRVDHDGVLRVTASFGVASLPGTATTKDRLIAAADQALYRAKRGGKNRVERAESAAAAR